MSKEIYISSTPQETRLAIVEKDELTEIYYERENEYTLAGSIYNGRVTRVLPGMQSSFVDIGLERDAFLYITDFMEEAGDSADFEGGEGRGGSKRGGDRNRPRRDEATTEATGEASAEEPARNEGRVEGEPRRERGGRNRNDRGRRDERPDDRPRDAQHSPAAPQEGFSADSAEPAEPTADNEGGEIGEGAPGADGSRRWRGRRGRRRGRGENGSPQELASTPGSTEDLSPAEPIADDEGFIDLDAQAAPQQHAAPSEPQARFERPERGRGGRDRGGRGGRDRGGRDGSREGSAPRAERSHSQNDEAADAGPAIEPIILPGESLSKYRPQAEGEAQASSSTKPEYLTPKPSTEFIPLTGWDGGSVLPGETLSRRREPEAQNSRSSQGGGSGRDRRRDRDQQRGENRFTAQPRQQLDPAEAVQPAVTSGHEIEPASQPFTDDAPAYQTETFEQELDAKAEAAHEEIYETQTDAAPHEPEAVIEAMEAVEEFHETVAEYEPGDEASASYRVDPAGTSEFRQGAPEEDLAEVAFEDVEQHETAPAPTHEFTTLQPSGELISEAPHTEAAPHDAELPSAPIAHEAAVQSVHLDHAEHTQAPQDAGLFAPGDGELEEELLDDDEADAASEVQHLNALGLDDDAEEETLEGAADLGSMLREMSIDQITRPEEPAHEIDDEDEDFDIDEEDIDEDEFESDLADDDTAASDGDSSVEDHDLDEAALGEDAVEGEEKPARTEGAADGQRRSRDGRRDGRRGGRDRGSREGGGSGSREGSSREGAPRERSSRDSRSGGHSRSGGGGRSNRHSVQATDLPAISDLLKPGQEVLVQIAKEPIAKKGARITSHIALPGRFLVFMPTVSHTGVSRKIESSDERRRLKEILLSEKGDAGGGFIVRTAAAGASEEELRSDLRFLLNLWTDIKARSESSKSPALIYHDLNLVERILRDQVTDNFSAIWVDTEAEYERVLRFLQRFQPALIRRVKLYSKETPLFEQFGITEEINKALRAKVWLKSGGSIVINQTEALVAIDINTGKFVGKTARLEDTILKTNLDAIPEIVRQIRLRDLGGIIIIDFIDMDERRNRNKVLAALEEELKSDRAPSKVLPFNDFGLIAITRKRVKQSLERTLSTTCGVCAGTGMVKSPVTVCNDIYIEMRKMHKHLDKGDMMLRVNPEVVKQLKNNGGKWLQEMEEMSGKTILVKSDPALHPEQFDIH